MSYPEPADANPFGVGEVCTNYFLIQKDLYVKLAA